MKIFTAVKQNVGVFYTSQVRVLKNTLKLEGGFLFIIIIIIFFFFFAI